jgi:hypothetical protein
LRPGRSWGKKREKGEFMNLNDYAGFEAEDFYEMRPPYRFSEVTVLYSELKHLVRALEDKHLRAKYYGEDIRLEWLSEMMADAERLLRNAQPK